ncbi:MAG: AzlC family ABC transporter permease [Rhodobacteraceae bacterium]|nr:AzlC family ABC transporter permease [Paracoccaceae bacterium]
MTANIAFTRAAVFEGARRLWAVAAFVALFGVAFGVAAVESGLAPLQATIMSAMVFSAMAQFAALELLQGPVAYLSLILVVASLSARHVIMSAALSSSVNQLPLTQRLLALSLLSDANFAETQTALRRGERDLGVLFGGGLVIWVSWVASTALGAYGGDLVGDPSVLGFGAVMLCFFAASVLGQLRLSQGLVWPVLAAVLSSVALLPVLSQGGNVIIGALIGGVTAAVRDAE